MKMRLSEISALLCLYACFAACSAPAPAPPTPDAADKAEIVARELRLETEAFIIKAANAESKGGVWKLEGVGIETRAGGAAALKLEAPAAVFEAQTGRINADGGIRARLGELELHAASLSVDAATDSYRLEGELRVATRGLSLAGESLHGRLSDSGDFVVSKARLRLNMNDGE